jgi:nondiscriminating glutamyl-tRNA synthetase
VGNARTALFNWLFAHKEKGSFLLRIEDTDRVRSDEASVEAVVRSLEWLKLGWDEGYLRGGDFGPYRQSERLDSYKVVAQKLLELGRAYWCYDNEAELEASRGDWQKSAQKQRHPHRDLGPEARAKLEAEGRKPSLRFATDDLSGDVLYDDLVRGEVRVDLAEIRDFNLMKSDGMPMYNFAAVADDHAMEISHVIRGEDGISNTPRQLLIYQALGWTPPRFGHVSFILGPDGQKLSKRHGGSSIDELKEAGYLPEAVLNYLGLLGLGGHGEGEEVYDLNKLTELFSTAHLVKKSAIFDYGKLDFLNAHYLRAKTPAELTELCAPFLAKAALQAPSQAWLAEAVELLKANCVHLKDFVPGLQSLLDDAFVHAPAAFSEAKAFASAKDAIAALKSVFEAQFPGTAEEAKAAYKAAQAASKIKGKDFFMPTRLALTGEAHGPEIVRLIPLMGRERCLARLDAFLKGLA